jgi:ABC-type uncharacterized transport system ATPase subunit/ABC-type uncharacterized transport system permease subunit
MTQAQDTAAGAPAPERPPALHLVNLTKRFGPVLADDHITFEALPGEVHALVGENGAGKTTLMNMIFGLIQPDEGEIFINGDRVTIHNPIEARQHHIGMVHQHFKLVPSLTVAENIFLGQEPTSRLSLDVRAAARQVQQLAERFQLEINPRARINQLSVGLRQRVEILKAISHDPQILILDEPTAVLTPQETVELFQFIRSFVGEGRTVIFITHKLAEVKEVTDRFTVIRDGKVVATERTADASEADIARLMVGREVLLRVAKAPAHPGAVALATDNLSTLNDQGLPAVRNVTLSVRVGEIVGIAGVEGNGQTELVEVVTGLRPPTSGTVSLDGKNVTRASVDSRRDAGIAYIPEDRLQRGVVSTMSIEDNLSAGYLDRGLSSRGFLLTRLMRQFSRWLIRRYDIRGARPAAPVRTLSGGNMQKVVLAREMEGQPEVLIASQPTRGVDIGATEFVHNAILAQRDRGAAVLLVSADLNEIRNLSDRILVMYRGQIVAEFPPDVSDSDIGLAMAGAAPNTATPPPAEDGGSAAPVTTREVEGDGAHPAGTVDAAQFAEHPEGPVAGEKQGLRGTIDSLLNGIAQPVAAVLLALIVGVLVILIMGDNPLTAYQYFLLGPLSSEIDIGNTLASMIPLLIIGISVAISFRAGIFNIGAEGQMYLGAFAGAWVGFTFVHASGPILVAGSILAAAIAGAIWALIPAVLLAWWGVDVIVSTLMLNYIAINITDYLVNNTFKDPTAGAPVSKLIAPQAWLPILIPDSSLHAGIIIAVVVAILAALLIYRTEWGTKLRFVGDNPHFASYMGVSVSRMIIQAMLISGALAGLSGAMDVLGVDHQFNLQFSPGYGFLGLTVALLGRLNPWGVIVAGFVYAVLTHGADVMQQNTSVPYPLVSILQGLIVLFMTASGLLGFWQRRRARQTAEPPGEGLAAVITTAGEV